MTTPLPAYVFFLACAALAYPAEPEAARYFSGTGFVVTRQGEAVTNAHVLENCSATQIRTTRGTVHDATIIARDDALDLALLSTPLRPERPARLRHTQTDVRVKERIMLMGYPQEAAMQGKYAVAFSHVRALSGLQGETDWLQFEDSVRMGNSGGPLLDDAGNVVGVVTGKATLIQRNLLAARDEVVGQSDFAINAATLRRFLDRHRIRYESRDSLMKLSPDQVERIGQEFIVNVLCRQS